MNIPAHRCEAEVLQLIEMIEWGTSKDFKLWRWRHSPMVFGCFHVVRGENPNFSQSIALFGDKLS